MSNINTGRGYPFDYSRPTVEKVDKFNDILRALNLPEVELDKPKQTNTMSKQLIALDQVRKGGYLVGSIDADTKVGFSSTPRIHETAAEARAECKRLSQLNHGKAFIFVKLAGAELVPLVTPVSI